LKVLITGASGFIGRRLSQTLSESNHSVVGTGRTVPPSSENFPGKFIAADLQKESDCRSVSRDLDAIVHCAGKAGAWGRSGDYFRANVVATQQLLAAARANGVTRFINLSSPSIYFDYKDQFDLKEDQLPKSFSNAYASTKYEAEKLVSAAHGPHFWTLSLRPRGVIGAGDRNWLPRIIAMRSRNRLVQVGDGKNIVDFTSVLNLADAVELALRGEERCYGRLYNITNGTPEPLWEVITRALEAVGLDGKRKKLPRPPMMALAKMSAFYHRLKKSEKEPELLPIKVGVASYSMTLNIDAAREILGYRPKTTTAQSIEEFARSEGARRP